jgi:4-hydroxybenzoate polyprenyltransferase
MYLPHLIALEPLITLVLIAGSATIGLTSCAYYMGVPVDPTLTVTSFVLVFFSYAINRYTDHEDVYNDPHMAACFDRNRGLFRLSIVLLAASLCWLYLERKLTWLHVLVACTSIAYSFRIVPCIRHGKLIRTRLKEICIVKNLVVAMLWGCSYFAISWLVYPAIRRPAGEIAFLMLCFAVSCFNNTVFSDIKDRAGDIETNVPTIPVRYGVRAAYRYGIVLPNSLLGLLALYLFARGFLSVPLLVLCFVNLLYPAVYIQVYRTGKCPYKLMRTVVDLSILIFPLGLFIVRAGSL